MTYAEKLKDPRWQKRRLEILSQSEFKCDWCGNDKETLHVHHFVYPKGREPWEVKDGDLCTLCETCHYINHSKIIPEIVKEMVSQIQFPQHFGAVRLLNELIINKYGKNG